MTKYKSKKATALVNGKLKTFHSIFERDRFLQLSRLQKTGKIKKLSLQPRFILQEGFTIIKNGKKVKIQARTYTADFYYIKDGLVIIEDTKGFETNEYKRSRAFLLYQKRNGIHKDSDILHFDVFLEHKKDKQIIWR
jgi:hypothetical protein